MVQLVVYSVTVFFLARKFYAERLMEHGGQASA
jgi:hypothetical protein